MDLFTATIGGLWATFVIYWGVSAYQTHSSRRSSTSYTSMGIFLFVVLGTFVLLNQFASLDTMFMGIVPETLLSRGIGILIAAAGIGVAMWARVHLGEQWSGLPSINEGHELITTGPYRYVRHPIYTGVLIALKGSLVVMDQVWVLVLLLLAIVAFTLKIRDEEALLEDEFGEEYVQYKERSKVLIPFVL